MQRSPSQHCVIAQGDPCRIRVDVAKGRGSQGGREAGHRSERQRQTHSDSHRGKVQGAREMSETSHLTCGDDASVRGERGRATAREREARQRKQETHVQKLLAPPSPTRRPCIDRCLASRHSRSRRAQWPATSMRIPSCRVQTTSPSRTSPRRRGMMRQTRTSRRRSRPDMF